MSKIDELIAELCQDGVSFKKLNEISVMKRGTSITKKDIVEGGHSSYFWWENASLLL